MYILIVFNCYLNNPTHGPWPTHNLQLIALKRFLRIYIYQDILITFGQLIMEVQEYIITYKINGLKY